MTEFLLKDLGADFIKPDFKSLIISTATIDARCNEGTNINLEKFFSLAPCIPSKVYARNVYKVWPPGTIYKMCWGSELRGYHEKTRKKSMRNCCMIWMWVEDKYVCVSIYRNNFHVKGCRKTDHAVEAAYYMKMHLLLLDMKYPGELFDQPPFIKDFVTHMVSFNFKIGRAINLIDFSMYLRDKFSKRCFTQYDPGIHSYSMPLNIPEWFTTLTINDNGSVAMRSKGKINANIILDFVEKSYDYFFHMLKQYNKR